MPRFACLFGDPSHSHCHGFPNPVPVYGVMQTQDDHDTIEDTIPAPPGAVDVVSLPAPGETIGAVIIGKKKRKLDNVCRVAVWEEALVDSHAKGLLKMDKKDYVATRKCTKESER